MQLITLGLIIIAGTLGWFPVVEGVFDGRSLVSLMFLVAAIAVWSVDDYERNGTR